LYDYRCRFICYTASKFLYVFTKTAKRLLAGARTTVYNVVIVPGVPLEDSKWSSTMKGRIYRTNYLYDEGITKNILFPGSAVYTPYHEGEIMSLYAIELSVPPGHIF